MKKVYVLILGVMLAILSISCVSAADNITSETDDLISVSEQDVGEISLSHENASALEINESVEGDVLTIVEGEVENDSSGDVLSTSVEVTPLGASYYSSVYDRTFKIGKFKATLSKSKYGQLYDIADTEDYFFDSGDYLYYYVGESYYGYDITSSGLRYNLEVKTNKFVKVKVYLGNKVYYKKTRARMIISYGDGQCGIPYRYMMFLTHKYANPGYDGAKVLGKNAKYFCKCKVSKKLSKLNRSKLKNSDKVYLKYRY